MAMTGRSGQWFDLSDTEAYGMSCAKSPIPFGRVVVQDSDFGNACRLPDPNDELGKGASTGEPIGVALFEKRQLAEYRPVQAFYKSGLDAPAGGDSVKPDGYLEETDTISIATQGRIYVRVVEDISVGDQAFYTVDADGLGRLQGSNANGALPLWTAKFVLQDALAGEIAVLDLAAR